MAKARPHPIVAQLRQRREDLGLTQATVAHRMGRGPTSISHWETGVYAPPVEAVAEWATALGVHLTLALKGASR
ncbi:helix-turn-helix domain-containing protein [Nocardiopsis ganjiahuensis]|uniref:helix-turn-helix domain-containing protein n=1 Tax=Nocardiopsis ganjiahuensis TaxID=239984 RepID=UPI00034616E0|nr:helix-turn-helix transcriptional regulator [Nocardiopsis ganjiahuensis]